MKIEYLQRILVDKLDELKCIYSSDFITEMKNDILNEEDIEKLKELDGFATDGIYLQYFKDNIQRKISPLSLSIFELKNYIKDGEGIRDSVRDLGDYENNFHKSGDSVNEVSDSLLGEGKPNEPEEYENNRDNEDSINIELEDDEDDGIDLEDDGIDLDIGSDYWDDFDYNEEEPNEEDDTSEEDLVEYNLDDEEEEPDEEPNEEDLVEYSLDGDEDDSEDAESEDDSENDSDDLVEYDLDSDDEDDLEDEDYDGDGEDSVDYSLEDDDLDDDSENDGLGFEMDNYLDSLLGNSSDTSNKSSDDSDTSNNSAKSNSNSSASQNTLDKPANNTKEKVFNNDFSNNAWDILNGAVDGISKIIRKF